MRPSLGDVARVLTGAGVQYVVVGTQATNLYTDHPRKAGDLDVITAAPAKAARALRDAFPHLSLADHPLYTRFTDGRRGVLDLIKARPRPQFGAMLGLSRQVRSDGAAVAVATFEAALTWRFFALTLPGRTAADRRRDRADFSAMVRRRRAMNRRLLRRPGDLTHASGGAALLGLIDDARAGSRLRV